MCFWAFDVYLKDKRFKLTSWVSMRRTPALFVCPYYFTNAVAHGYFFASDPTAIFSIGATTCHLFYSFQVRKGSQTCYLSRFGWTTSQSTWCLFICPATPWIYNTVELEVLVVHNQEKSRQSLDIQGECPARYRAVQQLLYSDLTISGLFKVKL